MMAWMLHALEKVGLIGEHRYFPNLYNGEPARCTAVSLRSRFTPHGWKAQDGFMGSGITFCASRPVWRHTVRDRSKGCAGNASGPQLLSAMLNGYY